MQLADSIVKAVDTTFRGEANDPKSAHKADPRSLVRVSRSYQHASLHPTPPKMGRAPYGSPALDNRGRGTFGERFGMTQI